MDDTSPASAPAEWIEALERSQAELAAGKTVPAEVVHKMLRESAARIEARLKVRIPTPEKT
jgi:hypothetical protein